jgi:hypothetical protein
MNAFVLHKQHLSRGSSAKAVLPAVEGTCGLHSTISATPCLSLFARIDGFKKEDLERELYVRRALGKIRCMRKTVHVLTREMIPVALAATRRLVVPHDESHLKFLGVSEKEYEDVSARAMEVLQGGAMTARQVKEAMDSDLNVSAILNRAGGAASTPTPLSAPTSRRLTRASWMRGGRGRS